MRAPLLAVALAPLSALSVSAVRAGDFALFESGQVRPLALAVLRLEPVCVKSSEQLKK
jgi:hypothetical protein